MTYVSQCNQPFVPVAAAPVVWEEGEHFRRDSVDRGEIVPHGADHTEDLQHALLENVDLNKDKCEPRERVERRSSVCFTSALFRVVAILQNFCLRKFILASTTKTRTFR